MIYHSEFQHFSHPERNEPFLRHFGGVEKVKFNLPGITIDRAFIEEDIEWGNLNSNSFHLFIEKFGWVFLIFTLSVFFVTPVAIYSIVDPVRDKLVKEIAAQ